MFVTARTALLRLALMLRLTWVTGLLCNEERNLSKESVKSEISAIIQIGGDLKSISHEGEP